MPFIQETAICERAVRRLARSRGVSVNRQGNSWMFNGVELSDDEAWDTISRMPQVRGPYGRL